MAYNWSWKRIIRTHWVSEALSKIQKTYIFLALAPFMSQAFFIMSLSVHFCVDSSQWLGKHNPPFIIYKYSIGPVPLMVYSGTEVLDIEAFIEHGLLGAQSSLSFCCIQCQHSDEVFEGLSFRLSFTYCMFSMALIYNVGPVCVYTYLKGWVSLYVLFEHLSVFMVV